MKRDNVIYMAITADKYELPMCAFSTIAELADWLEIKARSAQNYISRNLIIKKYGVRLIKVVT